jgi:hypothetical protein
MRVFSRVALVGAALRSCLQRWRWRGCCALRGKRYVLRAPVFRGARCSGLPFAGKAAFTVCCTFGVRRSACAVAGVVASFRSVRHLRVPEASLTCGPVPTPFAAVMRVRSALAQVCCFHLFSVRDNVTDM